MTAVLLDSHAFIWLVTDPDRLSPAARATLGDPERELFLSVANGWEQAIKHGLGKLGLSIPLEELLVAAADRARTTWLPVRAAHMLAVASLPARQRDPFDRMIVAQGLVERLPIVSADPALDAYGVTRIW